MDEAQTELRNRIEQAAALQQRLDAADRKKAEVGDAFPFFLLLGSWMT